MLKAIGKFIDTLPLKHLLSLEEGHADTVIIETDRYYQSLDLSQFTFIMRGVTESGTETQTQLEKTITEDGNYLHLTWNISSLFTTEAGKLFLDLFAYHYHPDTDVIQNPPDELLRYQLPEIEIRDIPEGSEEASESESRADFYAQVRDALRTLQNSVGTQGELIRNMTSAIAEHHLQILALQDRIQVMTQAQYDLLNPPDPDVIYILTDA